MVVDQCFGVEIVESTCMRKQKKIEGTTCNCPWLSIRHNRRKKPKGSQFQYVLIVVQHPFPWRKESDRGKEDRRMREMNKISGIGRKKKKKGKTSIT